MTVTRLSPRFGDGAEVGAVAGLALLGAVALYPVVSAGFVLVDDHEILSLAPQALNARGLPPAQTLTDRIFVSDAAGGRVRPLYYVVRYAEIGLLDGHPQVWHLLYAALGVLSAVLSYGVLRQMGTSRFPACLGAAWVIVAPGVSSVWIRLGPQESMGTVLLLAAVGAMLLGLRTGAWAGWNWLFVAAASASTLIKESYVLVPPALFALRLLLLYAGSGRGGLTFRTALWPAALPVGVGAVVLAIAFVTVQRSFLGSYGGRYVGRTGQELASATTTNLEILAQLGGIVVPLLALGLLVEVARRRRITREVQLWCGGAAVVCLLVVPQLVLYRQDPGFTIGRYILPAGLGLAGGIALGANWLRARRQRLLFVVVTEVWLLILCFGAVRTWFAAELFRADSAALARMVAAVDRAAPIGAVIGIAADPVEHEEFLYSLPYQLAASGRPDLGTRLLPTPADGSSTVPTAGCADLAAVVVFSNQERAERALPCLATAGLHLEMFAETASLSGPVPAFVREFFAPVTASYSALLP